MILPRRVISIIQQQLLGADSIGRPWPQLVGESAGTGSQLHDIALVDWGWLVEQNANWVHDVALEMRIHQVVHADYEEYAYGATH